MLADRDDRTHHSNVVEGVLLDLAGQQATGCLQVRDPAGEEALVFLQDGLLYTAFVPGPRPLLGTRLISSGKTDADSLARALEVQQKELPGWRLGELLVHLGYAELEVVEEFVLEQLKDMLADLFGWTVAIWQFLPNKRTRHGVGSPSVVRELIVEVRTRRRTLERIAADLGGQDAVPVLTADPSLANELGLAPNDWALLGLVDGRRTVEQLATECGFTGFEAGQVVRRLTLARLVTVEHDSTTARTDGEAAQPGVDAAARDTVARDTVARDTAARDTAGRDTGNDAGSRDAGSSENLAARGAGQTQTERAERLAAAVAAEHEAADDARLFAERETRLSAAAALREMQAAPRAAEDQGDLDHLRELAAPEPAEAGSAGEDGEASGRWSPVAPRPAAHEPSYMSSFEVSAMLRELSMAEAAPASDPARQQEAQVPAEVPAAVTTVEAPNTLAGLVDHYLARENTDTTSLLRELSNLYSDDGKGHPAPPTSAPGAAPAPPAAAPTPRASAPVDKKKRRGLFGR